MSEEEFNQLHRDWLARHDDGTKLITISRNPKYDEKEITTVYKNTGRLRIKDVSYSMPYSSIDGYYIESN